MKLLFDITPTQWFANGAGVYTTMVLEKALEMSLQFDCLYSQMLYLPDNIWEVVEKNNCKLIPYRTCADIEKIIRKNRYEKIFFGSLSNTECKIPDHVHIIVTIHDLRFIEVPNDKYRYLYRNTLFARCKQIAAGFILPSYSAKQQYRAISNFINHPQLTIVTVSHHTKYSILNFFPSVSTEIISVLYCPYPEKIIYKEMPFDNDFLKESNIVPNEYILIIGANRWIKNSYRALIALDELISNNQLKNKKVFVIGQLGSAIIRKLQNRDSFVFDNYLPIDKLQLLYKNAFCFIYPTLQEGFGIPPLEAMAYGTPVLASAVSAIPEICGEGVLYFNPYSITEIKNRVIRILNDNVYKRELILKSERHLTNLYKKQQADLKLLIKLIFT